ncbi:AMP-binding enzyme 1 [Elsinoe fawcettii]|nr:AMP-binding enzyme 1 [Elsinoe fawcettii]
MIYHSKERLNYPRDITLTDLILNRNITNTPAEKPAIIDGLTGTPLFTHASLRTAVRKVAHYLQHELRLQKGEVVAIFSYNKPYFPIFVHGILAAQGTVTALNPLYGPTEIAHVLQLSKPRHIICEHALLSTLHAGIRATPGLASLPEVYIWDNVSGSEISNAGSIDVDLIIRNGSTHFEPLRLSADEIRHQTAFICFSSGTSGLVKGVRLSHGNIVANIHQHGILLRDMFVPSTVFALAVPMFHILGLAGFCCQYIAHGAPIVLFEKFDFPALVAAIKRDRITHLNVVPPMALEFLRNPAAANGDFSSVRCMMNAAAPLKQEIADLISKKLDCVVTQWYGMTEASPSVMSQKENQVHVRGTVGRLLPGMELRIMKEDGSDVAIGDPGELAVRGPNLMQGYVRTSTTQQAADFLPDGFFPTGDIGYIDEQGFCYLVDRAKEMIKVKGNQVAPAELEALLLAHPQVTDAAVCGVLTEDTTSETPIAYIAPPLRSPDSSTIMTDRQELKIFCEELQKWANAKVASYKRIRGGVHVLPNGIPRIPSGKILRRLLPANLARAQASQKEPNGQGVVIQAKL